jgi:hypothetical protein
MDFKIKPDDSIFSNSPDTGHPECICSRCGNEIGEDEVPIRIWPSETREYRFCENCQREAGILIN